MEQQTRTSVWNLYDHPFVYTCGPRNAVKTFLEFLTHPDAKLYEIESLSFYSATLKLVGDGGEVYLTLHTARVNRAERHELCEALREYPAKMPKIFRQKLATFIYLFFDLDTFPKAG